VINIITKKGAEISGLQYQKGYGAFNTGIENIMLGVKKSNLPAGAGIDLVLSGSLFNTNGPRFANRHPRYSNSYVSNAWSFNGSIIYTLKKVKTTLSARAFQTPTGTGEFFASPTKLTGLPSPGNQNTGTSGIMQADFNGEKPSLIETYARTAFLQSEYTPNSKLTLFIKAMLLQHNKNFL